jgi:Flp pilus assembly protein TadD
VIRRQNTVRCLLLTALGCAGASVEPPAIDPSLYATVREAVGRARAAVQRTPGSASAWGDLAMLLDAHDLTADARECYRRAVDLDPDDPRWAYLLANQLMAESPEEAERLLAKAARLGDGDSLPELRLAELRLAGGDAKGALHVLSALRRTAPHEPRALMLTAIALEQADDPDEALDHAFAAATLAPSHRGIRELLSRLLYRLGRQDEATRAAEIAASLPSGSRGWPDRWLESVAALRRDPYRSSDEALARARQGDPDACDRLLQSLVRTYPEDWTFAAELARFRIRRGDATGGEAAVDVARHPDAKELWKLRGAARLLSGDWAGAANDLRRAVTLDAADAAAWGDLAHAHEQMLNTAAAIRCLERAVVLEPLDEEYAQRLAQLIAAPISTPPGSEECR